MTNRDLVTCCAVERTNLRVRRGATHCRNHEVEWHDIQRHQRELIARGHTRDPRQLAALKARRVAMGMVWPPRNFSGL